MVFDALKEARQAPDIVSVDAEALWDVLWGKGLISEPPQFTAIDIELALEKLEKEGAVQQNELHTPEGHPLINWDFS